MRPPLSLDAPFASIVIRIGGDHLCGLAFPMVTDRGLGVCAWQPDLQASSRSALTSTVLTNGTRSMRSTINTARPSLL